MATALHEMVMARANDLTVKVWHPTPWIVDVFTDRVGSERDVDMWNWCRETFGPESSPIHGHVGTWHRGGATVHGWTWYGFATEEQMHQFQKVWPHNPE